MTQPLVHVHEIVFSTTDGKEEILQSDSENLSWTSSALLTYDKSWITKIWHEDIAPCQTVLALKYCNFELPSGHGQINSQGTLVSQSGNTALLIC